MPKIVGFAPKLMASTRVGRVQATKDINTSQFSVAVFSSSPYVEEFLEPHFQDFRTTYIPSRLDAGSVRFAEGHDVVCNFVNDECDAEILKVLSGMGVRMVANRCAGYDRVDLSAAKELGIAVARVPTYSPESVAEAGLCLLLATARNLRSATLKVAVGNYTLDGLVGTQLYVLITQARIFFDKYAYVFLIIRVFLTGPERRSASLARVRLAPPSSGCSEASMGRSLHMTCTLTMRLWRQALSMWRWIVCLPSRTLFPFIRPSCHLQSTSSAGTAWQR